MRTDGSYVTESNLYRDVVIGGSTQVTDVIWLPNTGEQSIWHCEQNETDDVTPVVLPRVQRDNLYCIAFLY